MIITHKAVKGIFWVSLTTLVTRACRFITTLILAKLLLPSDFGILAIGLIVIESTTIFRDLGLGQAIIHRQKDIEEASDTAFIMNQGSAFILLILVNLIASPVAIFFKNPVVEPIIRVLSLTVLINALATVPSFLLDKQLEFRKKFLPESISTVVYCIIVITLAFLKFGVWSIVYAQIIYSITFSYSIWKISGWRFHLRFNRPIALELFSYGKYIIGNSILVFCSQNIDNAAIGKFIDTRNLGFYTFAMMIANLPAIYISHLVGRVTFPAYSQIQKDKERLSKTYFKTLKYISFFVIPVSFGILIFCPDLLRILYADKWSSAIIPLQILVFYGLFRALTTPSGNILMAIGAIKWLALLEVLSLIVVILFIYPVTKYYGIIGVSILMTIITICGYLIVGLITNKYINADFKYYLKIILPYIIISSVCGFTAYFLAKLISSNLSLLLTISAILLTAFSYLFLNFLYDKELKNFFINLKQRLLSL